MSIPFANDISAEVSKALVSFTADDTPTNPVDPTDPDNPGTGPGTGTAGPLSIDYVPELAFGSQKITGKIETYSTTNKTPYVQVTDKRGTGAGYSVSAKLSNFQVGADTTKILKDARLDFNNSEMATISSNGAAAPTAKDKFTLSANGDAVEVLKAEKNQGMGTWIERWLSSADANENIKLTVNTANALSEAYEGTIDWTIGVTP
ncbi:MAG: WxL domain-containing protein [Erysipelotrichales bacterium]